MSPTTSPPVSDAEFHRPSPVVSHWWERSLHLALAIAASIPIMIGASLVVIFAYQSTLFFQQVPLWSFLTQTQWTPLFPQRECGVGVIAVGTLMIATIATLVAVPVGILSAIYLSEYASPMMRRLLKPTLEALAGVPTVVYGYFALLTVTPFLQRYIPEMGVFNALSAGLMTGVLITPIVSSLSEDAIASVPLELRDGAYALGFTHQEVMTRIVLPSAFPGIAAAITLAVSRALGETMIAAIAAGQHPNLTLNPLVPIESMTAFIVQVSLGDVAANSFIFHTIFAVGMVLFLITLFFNWVGHWLVRHHQTFMNTLTIPKPESGPGILALPPSPMLLSGLVERFKLTAISPVDFAPSFMLRRIKDRLFQTLALLATFLGLAILTLLLTTMLREGFALINWEFLTRFPSRNPESAGIYPALAGTICLLVLTALFTFPIGIAAAIYLEEYVPSNAISRALEIHLDNLTAIPSILYGLLGLALFVRTWNPVTGGRSLFSAGLILAVIVLPMLIITTRSALRNVPNSHRQAGYSVGMSRFQVIWHIVLPAAFAQIVTGMLLALSRAIGETSPLVAIGAAAFITFAPDLSVQGLRGNFSSLPTQIFYWASRPQPEFQHLAAATIIVLGVLVLAMNIVAVLVRDAHRPHR